MTNIKSCNILGNGPSRKSYSPNGLTNIGCKVPWAPAEFTIIKTLPVINKLISTPTLIPLATKLILLRTVFDYIIKNNFELHFKNRIADVYDLGLYELTNSVQDACLWVIKQGITEINIYGCDSYFGDTDLTDSYSHLEGTEHYLDKTAVEIVEEKMQSWKNQWEIIVTYNPNIKFNFIK
jgi:hypothetical protein